MIKGAGRIVAGEEMKGSIFIALLSRDGAGGGRLENGPKTYENHEQ